MSEAYDDGYQDITGVDIVEEVLETMRLRNGESMAELMMITYGTSFSRVFCWWIYTCPHIFIYTYNYNGRIPSCFVKCFDRPLS